ncbi:putative protein N(5)-glutamine methyltransferase [Micromonospora sp. CPCC 206060]
MPAPQITVTPSAVIARLRAAGCVFAEEEAELILSSARSAAEAAGMVERRAAGLPLEHVLGWAEFCGRRMVVEPGVFVPRRRTEFLVERAAHLCPPTNRTPIVIDLCCGSGALGVALAEARGRIDLHAADLDPVAVRCARHNVGAVGGQVYQGDLFRPLPATLRGRVDILLANVPYVPSAEVALLPAEARVHEPRLALDGGADGLDVLRRVAAEAPAWLAPDGHLLFETGEHQVRVAVAIVADAGLVPTVARCAERYATVVTGTRPARRGLSLPGVDAAAAG